VGDETRSETRYLALCDTCASSIELTVDLPVVAFAELTTFLAAHKDCDRFAVRLTIPSQP
jgi:hypothetical protein